MGTYSDIRDQRYWTELDIGTSDIGLKRAESDIVSDIGMNFYPISDIRQPLTLYTVSTVDERKCVRL